MTIDHMLNPSARPDATAAQVKLALQYCLAVADTVREVGTAPEGPIYAALSTKGISHTDFEAIVRTLCSTGLVTRAGHCLKWNGPQIATKKKINQPDDAGTLTQAYRMAASSDIG